MDNQHRKISGYRELSQAEIDTMNKIKALAQQVGDLMSELEGDETYNQRWLAIGKTDLQKGFMAVTRAVAKPTTF